MEKQSKFRKIAELDLSQFQKPTIHGNRSFVWRAAWYLLNALIFQASIGGLLPNKVKATILRLFGARVGAGFVCKPRVNIKYPWFLEVGKNVWIGENVWIDNVCRVEIGNNVCLSQGARILTGSHDWSQPNFPFFAKPVILNDGVWLTAFRIIRPGVEVRAHTVVLSDLSASDVRMLGQ